MPTKIDERVVRTTAAPAQGSTTIWDSEINGFILRVYAPTPRNPGGARAFAFDYRIGGVERRIRIGKHPAWSALAARHEAKALRQRVDRSEDPALEKREAREAPTVADLAERYRLEHLATKAKRSQANNWAMVKNDLLPDLGARRAADVHQGDMIALHRKIAASGRPVHANRVLAVASTMFSLSLKPMAGEAKPWRDAAQGNPCRGVERSPEQGRERFFSPDELATIGAALDAYGDGPAANCLCLVMLSGCRPGEALAATWAEFSEPGIWVKSASATKQRRVHRAPLSPDAAKLIEGLRLKRERSVEYVFPWGTTNRGRKEINKAWAFVKRHAGLEASARIYDLRHSFGSAGAHAGLSVWILGKLLGHSSGKTTEKYLHAADNPLRDAAAKVGAAIAGGNVVSIKRGRGK
jgi:integrase